MTHAHDFDFYVGTWQIHNRRLRNSLADSTDWYEFEATSRARPVLGGTGNFDEFDVPSEGISGLTLRLFDPERDEWLLYWAGSRGGPLGASAGRSNRRQSGRVLRRRRFRRPGQSASSNIWSEITPTSARWEQAFSTTWRSVGDELDHGVGRGIH